VSPSVDRKSAFRRSPYLTIGRRSIFCSRPKRTGRRDAAGPLSNFFFNALSKLSLPKLFPCTKCVPTTAVAYFFVHVTLILINLSFLPGRQPLTLLPRPHLHSSPARLVLSSSSFRFLLSFSLSFFLSLSRVLLLSFSLVFLTLARWLPFSAASISFSRTHAYVKSHFLSYVLLPSA